MLNVEAINIDTDDWVFGCSASDTDGTQRYWYRIKNKIKNCI